MNNHPRTRTALALLPLAVAAGCSSGDGPTAPNPDAQTASAHGPTALTPDPHQDGRAAEIQLLEVRYGRLVDVYALDAATGARRPVLDQLLIGAHITSDGIDYDLSSALGAPRDELTILHPADTPVFARALRRAHEARERLEPRALDSGVLANWPVVPRNAALELTFDDLLDPASIEAGAVHLLVGDGLDERFTARVVADPNHGEIILHHDDRQSVHAPTRVIVDLSISELEAAASDPPLTANPAGLPAASSVLMANAALCMPLTARPALGQIARLTNLSGAGLAPGPSAPFDARRGALTLEFRSGGPSDVTGDMNMGFLGDTVPPSVVGEFRVDLLGPVPTGAVTPQELIIPRMAWSTGCTTTPKPGDRLSAPGMEAVVLGFSAQDAGGVNKLLVRVVQQSGPLPIPGAALLISAFDPNLDEPSCFLRFLPGPSSPPATGVAPEAVVRLRFSEPMDPESLTPFDTYRVQRVPNDPSAFELIVGEVLPSPDTTRFRFAPSLPLDHLQGQAETYYVALASGANGPTDLAGNPLAAALPVVPFTLDAAAATSASAGLVFRFDSADELYDDGLSELHGQHLYDLGDERIVPRPITRFPISADRDKPLPSAMTQFPPGVQGALNPLGSKLHSLWRYVDVGFSATDETNYNVDVEGLSWAPVGGAVVSDSYDEYQISLGHSARLPDEALNMNGFPHYPASGFLKTYAQNFLPPEPDGGAVVHPKQRGYTVNPADLYVGVSGTLLMPWPMNQGIPLEDFEYYTWRDTALVEGAGPNGAGVPLMQEVQILGLPVPAGSFYPPGEVRSAGLPLLMEFRCYPDFNALGLNAFDVSLAANSSSRPNFRAFSSGGINASNQPVIIDPDLQTMATGGFNPSSNPPGATTPGTDNVFFIGQLDLITRVSRTCSIWLPTSYSAASFAQPVIESSAPGSSSVVLAFRGATDIVLGGGATHITEDASRIDLYGDPFPLDLQPDAPIFLGGDASWNSDLQALDGSSWFQFRVTFVGDAATNETAALDSLGFAFAP